MEKLTAEKSKMSVAASEALERGIFDRPKTNSQMYKELEAYYDANIKKGRKYEDVAADVELRDFIIKTFDMNTRHEVDLNNLTEYIVAMTLMCGQDVANAKLRADKVAEKKMFAKHKLRCDMMSAIVKAVEHTIYPPNETFAVCFPDDLMTYKDIDVGSLEQQTITSLRNLAFRIGIKLPMCKAVEELASEIRSSFEAELQTIINPKSIAIVSEKLISAELATIKSKSTLPPTSR